MPKKKVVKTQKDEVTITDIIHVKKGKGLFDKIYFNGNKEVKREEVTEIK